MKNKRERNQLQFPSFGRKYFPLFRGVRGVFILTIFLATLTLTACKKYPEGPLISFRSAWQRLRGEWQITSFYMNGSNALDSVSNINYIEFDDKMADTDPFCAITVKGAIDSGIVLMTGLENRNKEILLSRDIGTINDNRSLQNFLLGLNTESVINFKIEELRFKKMLLERDYDGVEYKVELKKIKEI